MARIAIVGGHGKVAQQLIEQLTAQGDSPVALVRTQEYEAELVALGAETQLVDIESDGEDAFARAFASADAVVFTAGGGADGNKKRKWTVDYAGSVKSAAGAVRAGVSRFVQVSAIAVDQPLAEDTTEVWRAYVEAKRDADAALRASDLRWTILRPGGLTDDAGTGTVTLGATVERAQIPRADVAALIVAVLADDRTVGQQWEVVGGDQPIAEAIDAAVT